MFDKKEIFTLLGTTILLGIIFGFNDGKETFVFADWLQNFLILTIMSGASVLIHETAHKLVARRKNVHVQYTFWTLKRLSTQKRLFHRLPIGILLAIITTIFTNGRFYFTAIGSNNVIVDEKKRLGRRYKLLTEYEEALILLSGPVANILFVLVLTTISRFSSIDLSNFIIINLILASWYMLPLPGLDGARIFFCSRNVYFFGLSFLVVAYLLRNTGVLLGTLLSAIIAFGILTLYYYKYEQ